MLGQHRFLCARLLRKELAHCLEIIYARLKLPKGRDRLLELTEPLKEHLCGASILPEVRLRSLRLEGLYFRLLSGLVKDAPRALPAELEDRAPLGAGHPALLSPLSGQPSKAAAACLLPVPVRLAALLLAQTNERHKPLNTGSSIRGRPVKVKRATRVRMRYETGIQTGDPRLSVAGAMGPGSELYR